MFSNNSTNPRSADAADAPAPGTTAVEGGSLRARTDRRCIPNLDVSERHVLVEIIAPTRPRDVRRAPANLGYVVDRSGSMSGWNKLALAKQAVIEAIARQDDADGFALVVYDSEIDVVTPATRATAANRAQATYALAPVQPRSSTNLSGGWLAGCEQVASRLRAGGVNRVLLLTDGLANVGVDDPLELARMAAELRARGITTSTFGVGPDFNERLLQAMADAGGGHFYFIGDVAQMRDHITSEVGEALDVAVRGAVLEIRVPGGVTAQSLSPYRTETLGDRVRVHLGDLVSGQVISLVVGLQFPAGTIGSQIGAEFRLADADGLAAAASLSIPPVIVSWTYADAAAVASQERDVEVDRAVALLRSAQVREEAVGLNREGRYHLAGAAVRAVKAQIAGIAGSDATLLAMSHELGEEAHQWAAPMPEMERKARHFASSAVARSRSVDGKAVKRD